MKSDYGDSQSEVWRLLQCTGIGWWIWRDPLGLTPANRDQQIGDTSDRPKKRGPVRLALGLSVGEVAGSRVAVDVEEVGDPLPRFEFLVPAVRPHFLEPFWEG